EGALLLEEVLGQVRLGEVFGALDVGAQAPAGEVHHLLADLGEAGEHRLAGARHRGDRPAVLADEGLVSGVAIAFGEEGAGGERRSGGRGRAGRGGGRRRAPPAATRRPLRRPGWRPAGSSWWRWSRYGRWPWR